MILTLSEVQRRNYFCGLFETILNLSLNKKKRPGQNTLTLLQFYNSTYNAAAVTGPDWIVSLNVAKRSPNACDMDALLLFWQIRNTEGKIPCISNFGLSLMHIFIIMVSVAKTVIHWSNFLSLVNYFSSSSSRLWRGGSLTNICHDYFCQRKSKLFVSLMKSTYCGSEPTVPLFTNFFLGQLVKSLLVLLFSVSFPCPTIISLIFFCWCIHCLFQGFISSWGRDVVHAGGGENGRLRAGKLSSQGRFTMSSCSNVVSHKDQQFLSLHKDLFLLSVLSSCLTG